MIKINLLPSDLMKDESKNDILIIGGVLAGFVVVLLLAQFFYMSSVRKTVEVRLRTSRNSGSPAGG